LVQEKDEAAASSAFDARGERALGNDRFKDFCHRLRFSGSMNSRLKAACYFIVALPSISAEHKLDALQLLLGSDTTTYSSSMLHALARTSLVAPESAVVRAFIMDTSHTGAPCDALRQFRQQCVPGGGGRSMNWTTILRLYLSVYCRAPLSKDLWCSILSATHHRGGGGGGSSSTAQAAGSGDGSEHSTLSTHANKGLAAAENEAAVQAFVRGNPLAVRDLLECFLAE
jgi:hypothetical protein